MAKSPKYGLISLSDDQFEAFVEKFRSGNLSDKDSYAMWWKRRTIFHGDLLELYLYTTKNYTGKMWLNDARELATIYNAACLLLLEIETKITKEKSEEYISASKKNFEIKYNDFMSGKVDEKIGELSILKKFPPISEWKKEKEKVLRIITKNSKYFHKGVSNILAGAAPKYKDFKETFKKKPSYSFGNLEAERPSFAARIGEVAAEAVRIEPPVAPIMEMEGAEMEDERIVGPAVDDPQPAVDERVVVEEGDEYYSYDEDHISDHDTENYEEYYGDDFETV